MTAPGTHHPDDERWMAEALKCAARADGSTSPNPLVGAVVVKGKKVIARGWHKGPGTAHAEAMALDEAGKKARGATLYATLEPCCHTQKRTPPCAPRVAEAGLARVVIGMIDPNPKVAGGGFRVLEEAGLEVTVGVLKSRCKALNAPYLRAITTGLPWVTIKAAQTLDGKVATASGESKWITGEEARRHGHKMRHAHDAILVGIGTVLADDPALTCRIPGGRNPRRVVVDPALDTPLTARVLTSPAPAPTIVLTRDDADPARAVALEAAGAWVVRMSGSDHGVDLDGLLRMLVTEGDHRVLCEGGPGVAAALVKAGLANRACWFLAPTLMGGDDARGSLGGDSPERLADVVPLGRFAVRRLGNDLLIQADVLETAPEN